MATYLSDGKQTLGEVRTHVFDYTDDLLTGVTVSTAVCTYLSPASVTGTATVSITSPYVYATMGTLSASGMYVVSCLATLSDAEKSEIRVTVNVLPAITALTARAGMADLRDTLRGMTDVTEHDWTLGQQNFWDDLQLDRALDRHAVFVDHELMQTIATNTEGGTTAIYDYVSEFGSFETVASGTAYLKVQDATGLIHGTSEWTADYAVGQFTFSTNTSGSSMYLTGTAYDLNAAAADIWQKKAAHYASAFDFSTDNHNVRRSQLIENCFRMAKHFSDLAGNTNLGAAGGFQVLDMVRSDMPGYEDD
jgi:hypothetical protein